MLTHFSLFTGIGGLDLAAEWAGFETVGQCEFADYPTKVLEMHWPGVPRWRDIRDVTAESVRNRGIRSIDVISEGFPCQPFSVAGKQKGKEDDRYLWPEMLRVIRELTPSWVIGENVPGILSIAADDICKDLEREGYEVGVFNYEAAAVGAIHRRGRVFFVGHAKHHGLSSATVAGIFNAAGCDNQKREIKAGKSERTSRSGSNANVADTKSQGGWGLSIQPWRPQQTSIDADRSSSDVADTYGAGCKELKASDQPEGPGHNTRSIAKDVCGADSRGCSRIQWREDENKFENGRWWAAEPGVGRLANGIPSRVDRLKCLGNAVVPQQAYPIFRAITCVELGLI